MLRPIIGTMQVDQIILGVVAQLCRAVFAWDLLLICLRPNARHCMYFDPILRQSKVIPPK